MRSSELRLLNVLPVPERDCGRSDAIIQLCATYKRTAGIARRLVSLPLREGGYRRREPDF
jgi:hypothetical protein